MEVVMRCAFLCIFCLLFCLPIVAGSADVFAASSDSENRVKKQESFLLAKTGAKNRFFGSRKSEPLHLSVHKGKEESLRKRLAEGADPNALDENGTIALYQAASFDNEQAVKILLDAKADPNAGGRGNKSPLYQAYSYRNDSIAKLLLDAGADANIHDHGGKTLLYLAAQGERFALVKLLIDAGADVNAANNGWDKETPLMAAAAKGNTAIAQLLLNAGADPNAQDRNGDSPLFFAVGSGHPDMARLLLKAKVDLNLLSNTGCTPVFELFSRHDVNHELLKLLLEARANPNIRAKNLSPPLHMAAERTDLKAVRMLLAAGADPNFLNHSGRTALDMAHDPNVVRVLEKAGGKAVKSINEVPLYDELGRPMNKAAHLASSKAAAPGRKKDASAPKDVPVLINTSKEAEVFNETVAEERKGNRSPYLTRAILMDADIDELSKRLQAGTDINLEDPVFGMPLVQILEQHRDLDKMRFLLEQGADPNKGKPLLKAIRHGEKSVVMLLGAGADPMTTNSEGTQALILAVEEDRTPVVIALLRAGAKVDAGDRDGRTALYHALDRERPLAMIETLVENGASVTSFSALGVLPWRADNIPVALFLLRHGASAKVQNRYGETLVHWAVRSGSKDLLEAAIKAKVPVTGMDRDGITALHHAVLSEDAGMVALLLKAGAPVNKSAMKPGQKFVDHTGKIHSGEDDLLAVAVRKGNEEVIRILVAAGVNLNARENRYDRYTALNRAVAKGRYGISTILLDAGADPNLGDRYKRTPLHTAVDRGDLQSLNALIAKKAKLNVQDEDGETPLYQAARKGKAPMVEALLKAGANPDVPTRKAKRSCLHEARDPAVVSLLLAAKADPNAKDSDRETPLHAAARRNNAKVVQLLLAAKSDPHAKNDKGKTPIDFARDAEVIKLLEGAGGTRSGATKRPAGD